MVLRGRNSNSARQRLFPPRCSTGFGAKLIHRLSVQKVAGFDLTCYVLTSFNSSRTRGSQVPVSTANSQPNVASVNVVITVTFAHQLPPSTPSGLAQASLIVCTLWLLSSHNMPIINSELGVFVKDPKPERVCQNYRNCPLDNYSGCEMKVCAHCRAVRYCVSVLFTNF